MEAYLQYLEQVLGLKTLILPPAEVPADEEPVLPAHPSVRILFLAEKPWSPKAQELFEKMRDAMKVPAHETKVLFASEVSLPELQVSALSAERVVVFSQKLFDQMQVEAFLTHNPEELLRQPGLKKEAWEDLKKVMKSLGLL